MLVLNIIKFYFIKKTPNTDICQKNIFGRQWRGGGGLIICNNYIILQLPNISRNSAETLKEQTAKYYKKIQTLENLTD